MKVAEVTPDQAAALDPATLQPGQAIAVRFGDILALIGALPYGAAPVPVLVGELRDNNDQPLSTEHTDGMGRLMPGLVCLRAAVATPEGLRGLLDALQALAEGRTVRRARSAS